jgi:hypothetical protein
MTVQPCLAPHRDNPPGALGGLKLCAGHFARLRDLLVGPETLAGAYANLLDAHRGHRTASSAHVTGTTEHRLPIVEAVAELRSQIRHDLVYWTDCHAAQMRTTRPDSEDPGRLCPWLARYTDWSAAQPWIGDYLDVLSELAGHARRLIDLPAPRRTVVGNCVEYVDGRRCTGTLYTIARDAGDPTPVVVQCDTCPAAYDSTRWERLGKRLKRAA